MFWLLMDPRTQRCLVRIMAVFGALDKEEDDRERKSYRSVCSSLLSYEENRVFLGPTRGLSSESRVPMSFNNSV